MDSLYGGHQGISFVLKASFPTIDAMVQAFSQGANYTDVWYHEYCIIDTVNKNDPDNGKIFQRGLDYQNKKTGGAIELGQIVGPSSGTPYFAMETLLNASKRIDDVLDTYDYHAYPIGRDENGKYIVHQHLGPYAEGTSKPAIKNFDFATLDGNGDATTACLVPGKTETPSGEIKFNDTIKYTWVNIRRANKDADSWFYVGWQIPYTVIDYKIQSKSPYDENGVIQEKAEIFRTDNKKHPYYEEWDLHIPKGVKGDTLRHIRVIDAGVISTNNKIYFPDAFIVDSKTGKTTLAPDMIDSPENIITHDPEIITKLKDDIQNHRQIIVFDFFVYDNLANPTTKDKYMIYLGDFNIIDDLQVAEDGTLTVGYTHENDSVFTKKIRWVQKVGLTTGTGAAGGTFTIDFNNDQTPEHPDRPKTQTFKLNWIKGVKILEDGSVEYIYSGNPIKADLPQGAVQKTDGIYQVEKLLKWITSVTLDKETGKLIIDSNHSTPENPQKYLDIFLTWVKDVTVEEDGSITFVQTTGQKKYSKLLKWIDKMSLDPETGVLKVDYNNGAPSFTQYLDWVKDIKIKPNGDIEIYHTTGSVDVPEKKQVFQGAIKNIEKAEIEPDGKILFETNLDNPDSPGQKIKYVLKNIKNQSDFHLKYPTMMEIPTGIKDSKKVKITWNYLETPGSQNIQTLDYALNGIEKMVVREKDYHLFVLHSDPAHRVSKDTPGWVSGYALSLDVPGLAGNGYDSRDVFWQDLGTIKDQSGLLIGFNVSWEEVEKAGFDATIAGLAVGPDNTPGTGVCGYLQKTYPDGLTGKENSSSTIPTRHKIVTFTTKPTGMGETDKQDKEFYAYDYLKNQWYFLGKMNDSGMRDVKLLQHKNPSATDLATVNINGVVFMSETYSTDNAPLPKFWKFDYTSKKV